MAEFQNGQTVIVKPGAPIDGGGKVVTPLAGRIVNQYDTERNGTIFIIEVERPGVMQNWREYARCGAKFLEALE